MNSAHNPNPNIVYKLKTRETLGKVALLTALILFFPLHVIDANSLLIYGIELALLSSGIVLINGINFVNPCVLFLLFYIYIVALGPFGITLHGFSYEYDSYIFLLGPVALFAVGNTIGISCNEKIKYRKAKDERAVIPLRKKEVLYLLLILSVFLAAAYYLQNRAVLTSNFNDGRLEAASGNGIQLYLMQTPIVVIPMLFNLYFRKDLSSEDSPSKLALVIGTAVSTVILLVTGFRSNAVTMYLCIIIVCVIRGSIKQGAVIGSGLILIIFVTIYGWMRSGFQGEILKQLLDSVYVNGLNLQYVFNHFPSRTPFQYGYTYIINLLMLLPGPDIDFTLWLKEQLGMSFSGGGVTPTIVGEFYINFGIIGIVIGMMVLGYIGPKIQAYLKRNPDSFFAAFLTFEYAHCVGGGIANIIVPLLIFGLVYWILSKCATSKSSCAYI